MTSGALNPRDAKGRLAREIVTMYHSAEAAQAADDNFRRLFSGTRQQTLEDYAAAAEEVQVPTGLLATPIWISLLLPQFGLAKSRGEATRLIQGGGVYIDERRVEDPHEQITPQAGMVIRVGKRRVVKLAE